MIFVTPTSDFGPISVCHARESGKQGQATQSRRPLGTGLAAQEGERMIRTRFGRTAAVSAAAALAVLVLAGSAFADPTLTIGGSSGDTDGAAFVDPITAGGGSGDTSAGVATGSGSGSAAQADLTSGDTSGSAAVGCVEVSASSGSTSGGAQVGSCTDSSAGSSAAGSGAATGGVSSGDTAGSASVGCIGATGSSGSTNADAAVGSCTGTGRAAAGSVGSGDTLAGAGVGCITAGSSGEPTAEAQVGNCSETQAGGAGGSDPVDGNGTVAGGSGVLGAAESGDEGNAILAGLTSGTLPLTGLPLVPFVLAGLAALALAIVFRRRRAREVAGV
jgi:collagen type I alpha